MGHKKEDSKDKSGIYSHLHHRFLEERKLFLWKGIDDKIAEDLVERFFYLESIAPGKEITFFVNTPGGSVTAGLSIFDTIRLISSPVTVVVTGLAASMGSILLQAPEKGRRFLYPNSQVLIHQPLISGVIRGQASDIEIHAAEMEKTRRVLTKILSDGSGQDFEKVYKDCERDRYLTAQESLDYGLADKIIPNLKEFFTA